MPGLTYKMPQKNPLWATPVVTIKPSPSARQGSAKARESPLRLFFGHVRMEGMRGRRLGSRFRHLEYGGSRGRGRLACGGPLGRRRRGRARLLGIRSAFEGRARGGRIWFDPAAWRGRFGS
jgi:hypothetical protein